jgi:hypothetical protein
MIWTSVTIMLFGLLILFVLKIFLGKSGYPYKKKDYLMSTREKAFFDLLKSVLPPNYEVAPQVNMDKVLNVKAGETEWQNYKNKIDRKSFDYVVFTKNNYSPVLAIELDDSTHLLKSRMGNDNFKVRTCEAANLKLLRITVGEDTDREIIKNKLDTILNHVSS